MSDKIKLNKSLKIRLLKAIQEGEFDSEAFPELQLNTPRLYLVPAEALTDEQLQSFIDRNENNNQFNT